jgi:hypothetical protein
MKLTKKAFVNWLQEKNDFDTVGVGGMDESCPIACFLQDTIEDACYISVNGISVAYEKNYRSYERTLPIWAKNFVRDIDKAFGQDYISVEGAFAALNGELRERGEQSIKGIDFDKEWETY